MLKQENKDEIIAYLRDRIEAIQKIATKDICEYYYSGWQPKDEYEYIAKQCKKMMADIADIADKAIIETTW